MPARRLPVRPDLDHLRHQAKDLLRAIHRGEREALQDLQEFHPQPPDPANAKLADAQLTLARSYDAASWPRLVVCCNLIDAIWDDDVETVRSLVLKYPNLLTENAGIRNDNWGPPLSYASNLGRARWLVERGMDVDARAEVDENGFGGHSALFNAVVGYPNFWMNFTGGWAGSRKPQETPFGDFLLEHGANPNACASFRVPVTIDGQSKFYEFRDVTPLGWGKAFPAKIIVSEPAMRAIAARGGHE